MARDLVDSLLVELMKFDFRNGPLRRKFDGVKYALKRLENILYELAVTDTVRCVRVWLCGCVVTFALVVCVVVCSGVRSCAREAREHPLRAGRHRHGACVLLCVWLRG